MYNQHVKDWESGRFNWYSQSGMYQAARLFKEQRKYKNKEIAKILKLFKQALKDASEEESEG